VELGDRAKRVAAIQRSATVLPKNENTLTNQIY